MVMKKVRQLIYLLLISSLLCGVILLTGCSKDNGRLDTTGMITVTYDPLGGVWSTGASPEPRVFYAKEGSLLFDCKKEVKGENNSVYPTVRHRGYDLLGWYTKYSDETFQEDALGTYVKYAFEKAEDGSFKLGYIYVKDDEGDFVKMTAEDDLYESFDDAASYSSDNYFGENDEEGSFIVTRYIRYESYSEYNEEEDGLVTELYKQIDDGTDRAFTVYQEENPAHQGLQRYEAKYTFDEADRWDFKKDKVTAPVTLYARWKRSNTILWMNGNDIHASWIVGQNATADKIAPGKTISKTQNDPSRSGCTFVGWYKDKECTEKWDFKTDVFPTDSEVLCLYAKFLEGEWTTIGTKAQLSRLKEDLTANYVLTADIDCGGDANPFGLTGNAVFKGTLDGNGFKLYNFKINGTKTDLNYGLFRILDGATIRNLDCEYEADLRKINAINGAQFGAVAGGVKDGGATIENCHFTVTLSYEENDKFRYSKFVGAKVNDKGAYVGKSDSLVTVTDSTSTINRK